MRCLLPIVIVVSAVLTLPGCGAEAETATSGTEKPAEGSGGGGAEPAAGEAGTDTGADVGGVPVAGAAPAWTDVDVEAAVALLAENDKVVVLDIRTPAEFDAGHIDGAVHVDYRGESFKDDLGKLDRDATYLMHCASGGRSSAAKPIFTELGFKHVYHLKPGARGWQQAGQKLVQ